ncbi:MAG TPA: SsrA-binding protein SmpB [Candidatus Binataceae bacterium]|nr:SsrA-binding protein SmpB [Candidatus Binataceae bacterium]
MAQSNNKSNGAKSSAKSNGAKGDGYDLVAENRKARHDFFIEESLEAGMALTGTEVKSLRAHKANLRDSYARIKDGEAFLQGVHIGAYAPAGQFSHKETRARKLLMHRREIDRFWGRVRERGYSIVPLRIYFRGGRAKVELALAKGKHLYDKREAIARKSSRRDIERALKSRNQ